MFLTIYILSVLLCLVMFAAIAVNIAGLPKTDRGYVACAAAFFTLCPIINTVVVLIGVCGGVMMLLDTD